MSGAPPQSEQEGVPGYLMVLGALSVLILLFALGVGLIAFGVVDIGSEDPVPTPIGKVEGDLQSSGFTIRDSRMIDGKRLIDVNISVTNTGKDRIKNATMLVQCLDGGNVSTSKLIVGIDPGQTLNMELTLGGHGDPRCTSPIVSFDLP